MGEFMQLCAYIDSNNISGIWEWTKAYTGYFCVFAFLFAFFVGIVRRIRG